MAVVPDKIGAPDIRCCAGSALVGEIVMTFALCHVILHVATTSAQADNSYYGLAIGFTVLAGAVGVGPYSGGAFNPAVGIALPLLKGESLSPIWIYIVGPCVGAALAALVFAFTHSNELPGTGPLVAPAARGLRRALVLACVLIASLTMGATQVLQASVAPTASAAAAIHELHELRPLLSDGARQREPQAQQLAGAG